MSTHNIHLKYRIPKRYPIIISIMPPGVVPVTFRGSISNFHGTRMVRAIEVRLYKAIYCTAKQLI